MIKACEMLRPTSAGADADAVRYHRQTSMLGKRMRPQGNNSRRTMRFIHNEPMRPWMQLAYVVLAAAALVGVIVGAVSGDATSTILPAVLFVVIIANAVQGERGARRQRQKHDG